VRGKRESEKAKSYRVW